MFQTIVIPGQNILCVNPGYKLHTVGAVVKLSTAALRVAGSIPAWNQCFYNLQVVVPGLAVCVCNISMFVNAPFILELLPVRSNV